MTIYTHCKYCDKRVNPPNPQEGETISGPCYIDFETKELWWLHEECAREHGYL